MALVVFENPSNRGRAIVEAIVIVVLWTAYPVTELCRFLSQPSGESRLLFDALSHWELGVLGVAAFFPVERLFRSVRERWGVDRDVLRPLIRLPLFATVLMFVLQDVALAPVLVCLAAIFVQPDRFTEAARARLMGRTPKIELSWNERLEAVLIVLSSCTGLVVIAAASQRIRGVTSEMTYWAIAAVLVCVQVFQMLGVNAPSEKGSAATAFADSPKILTRLRVFYFGVKIAALAGACLYAWDAFHLYGNTYERRLSMF